MKYFLTIICAVLFLSANAQFGGALDYRISFDNNDSIINLWTGYNKADTNMKKWITIDTLQYHHNLWQIGHPNKTKFTSAYSAPNAIITDSVNACSLNDTSVFVMKFPIRIWEGLNYYKFNYMLDIDSGDIATVELSADTQKTWRNILTDTNHVFSFWKGKPDFSKSTTSWDTAVFFISSSLMPYPNDTFFVRFTFITGDSTRPRDGWMIDNFVVNYNGEGIEQIPNNNFIIITPNPANNFININYTYPSVNDVTINITNVFGQLVKTKSLKHILKGTETINTGDLSPCLYFYNISSVYYKNTGCISVIH